MKSLGQAIFPIEKRKKSFKNRYNAHLNSFFNGAKFKKVNTNYNSKGAIIS